MVSSAKQLEPFGSRPCIELPLPQTRAITWTRLNARTKTKGLGCAPCGAPLVRKHAALSPKWFPMKRKVASAADAVASAADADASPADAVAVPACVVSISACANSCVFAASAPFFAVSAPVFQQSLLYLLLSLLHLEPL